MPARDIKLRFADIVEAAETLVVELEGVSIDALGADRRKRWIVERGLEIISEASRHLPDDFKARNPQIPWPKVAGIGNILRHAYETIAHDILWHVVRHDLPALCQACHDELQRLEDG